MKGLAAAIWWKEQLAYKYQVYNEIKKGIMSGVYPAGSVMNERKLSEELGISRTPIREGLQLLARDGWILMETYKRAVVREFDAQYMWELSTRQERAGDVGGGGRRAEHDREGAFAAPGDP